MARKILKRVNVVIACTVSDDGSTITGDSIEVSGQGEDPSATNEYERGPNSLRKRAAWDGAKTGDEILQSSLTMLKRAAGM